LQLDFTVYLTSRKAPKASHPMLHLENQFFQLHLDPHLSTWGLAGSNARQPGLCDLRLDVLYWLGARRYQALEHWEPAEPSTAEAVPSPHGPLRQLSLQRPPNAHGLQVTLTFALPAAQPLLLWRLEVANQGPHPLHLERLDLLRSAPSPHCLPFNQSPACYVNGWQSWSRSGAYGAGERPRRSRLGPFTRPPHINAGTPDPAQPGHFAGDFFGVLGDRTSRAGLLLGFISQRQHFGSLEFQLSGLAPALRLWANGDHTRLDPGARQVTDWACLHYLELDQPDPLAPYLEAVMREHQLPPPTAPSPTGWCSWYHFYQKVTAADIRANLTAAADWRAELPLGMIQIDDGFEAQVGDWFSFAGKFPDGVAPLAQEIRAAGFTPGLWLAPFIVHPKSRLAAEHPDWLLRTRQGRPANAGFIWNVFTHALDLTVPAARDYAAQVVHTAAHEWGYPFLKLDFLYAAALAGVYHDPTRTRAQVLRQGLEALRQSAGPETHLLGCGCPLGPAVGLFESMRIGPDVAGAWSPSYLGTNLLFGAEPTMPSARNAIHNTLARVPLHRRWWLNDPDCLLLRPDTQLTLAEVQTLAAVIGLSGGTLLLSDHLPSLPAERRELAAALLPLIGQTPTVPDWFDAHTPTRLRLDLAGPAGPWQLLARFNWADQPADLTIRPADFGLDPAQGYLTREFWSGAVQPLDAQGLVFRHVPAHGCVLLAVRPAQPGQPQYLGSSLHLSQGQELVAWQAGPAGLTLRLQRPGSARGELVLSLPHAPQQALGGGQPLAWQALGHDSYRFQVNFKHELPIEVI
jgi:alpha-galactosidase